MGVTFVRDLNPFGYGDWSAVTRAGSEDASPVHRKVPAGFLEGGGTERCLPYSTAEQQGHVLLTHWPATVGAPDDESPQMRGVWRDDQDTHLPARASRHPR